MGLRSIWNTRGQIEDPVEKSAIDKRVEKIPTHELFQWVENSQAMMARDFREWQNSTQIAYLEDALLEIRAIESLIKALISRDKDE